MFGLGPTELIVVGIIIVLIFGTKRLPEIGKALGDSLRQLKKLKTDATLTLEKKPEEKSREHAKSIETELTKRVVEDVPVLKKSTHAKKKIDSIRNIVNS